MGGRLGGHGFAAARGGYDHDSRRVGRRYGGHGGWGLAGNYGYCNVYDNPYNNCYYY